MQYRFQLFYTQISYFRSIQWKLLNGIISKWASTYLRYKILIWNLSIWINLITLNQLITLSVIPLSSAHCTYICCRNPGKCLFGVNLYIFGCFKLFECFILMFWPLNLYLNCLNCLLYKYTIQGLFLHLLQNSGQRFFWGFGIPFFGITGDGWQAQRRHSGGMSLCGKPSSEKYNFWFSLG